MVKDAKKKKAEKKARTAEKQAKKTKKTEKKQSKKNKDDDSDADDANLDDILAEYQRQQEQFLKVTEVTSEPPSPRSSATLVASPSNTNELFLFGGEYYNGALASFYNDLYVYKISQDTWRKVTSPNSPLPRSGHAMCQGGNTGGIYLFGGEFSSPKQGTFYHYNDFWHLDPNTREWTKLDSKGLSPPARSGHRLVAHKNYILLFGGFQDTSQQTKYLSDLWLYDTQKFTWHQPVLPPASGRPDPRSSFSWLPHDSGAVLFGGYSRVKVAANAHSRGANAKGGRAAAAGGPAARMVVKPLVHQDCWLLKIGAPLTEGPGAAAGLPVVRWERRKKPVNAPNPPRAGATMAWHKGRGIAFGGVHDVEESEEGIESEFFNVLAAWNVDRNRFFGLSLRRPRAGGGKKGGGGGGVAEKGRRGGRGKADEEELLRNLALIEGKTAGLMGKDDEDVIMRSATPGSVDDEDGDGKEKAEKPVLWEMPHPRFNAALAVQDDTLYIFGGTFEKADREFTLDEMWAINLVRMDGAKQIFHRELADWLGSDDEDSEEEDDEEDDDEDEEDEDVDMEDDKASVAASTIFSDGGASTTTDLTEMDIEEPAAVKEDPTPQPRPFETLRDFFIRTSNEWQELELEAMKYERGSDNRSVKEIKGRAFNRAEMKWWDCREEIQALEDEQEAAGIGEVVSLADRGGKEGGSGSAGGAGRRR